MTRTSMPDRTRLVIRRTCLSRTASASRRLTRGRRPAARARGSRRRSVHEADQHEEGAAELNDDGEWQQPRIDMVGLHVARGAGVVRDLTDPLDDEDIGEHCAREETEGP